MNGHAHVTGWGADLDPGKRPAVPMERTPPRIDPPGGEALQQQPRSVEVLHSIEHRGITPVFGSTLPPRGLSGRLRRAAFRYSENDLRHWLVLLFADRVDMVEGLASDLARGHLPNLYAETGGRAELRHHPARAARKLLLLTALVGAGYWLWQRRRRH